MWWVWKARSNGYSKPTRRCTKQKVAAETALIWLTVTQTLSSLFSRFFQAIHLARSALRLRCLVLFFPLCLSACSSTTFLYNRLDLLIGWYVDDYVALTPEQAELFDQRLDALLLWHRQHELPEYADFIDGALVILDQPIKPSDMQVLSDRANEAADRLQLRITKLLIEFGGEISVEQRLEFLASMQENSERLKKKYLSRDEAAYRSDLREDFASAIKRFLGKLTREQKQFIAEGVDEFVRLDSLWLEDRDRWTTALEEVVRSNSDNWQEQARVLIDRRRADREVSYQRAFEHNAAVSLDVARQVLNARSDAQDNRLRRRLNAYRDDFVQLAQTTASPNSIQ